MEIWAARPDRAKKSIGVDFLRCQSGLTFDMEGSGVRLLAASCQPGGVPRETPTPLGPP